MSNTITLERVLVDMGYPDPGHYEYVLVRKCERKSKILQSILGHRTSEILSYGIDRPSNEEVNKDIERLFKDS